MIQHIDIFYSKFIIESLNAELFNEIVNFLQHFQQCRNQYSKSNMFEWLSTCLEKFVFEWFNDQSKFIFLYKFDIILTNAFFFKQINNSFFSISALKLTCEIFENLTISVLIISFVSFVSSKQKFEFVMIFETVISLKIAHFSFSVSEIVSKSMKNTSIQYVIISSKSSFFQTFESKH